MHVGCISWCNFECRSNRHTYTVWIAVGAKVSALHLFCVCVFFYVLLAIRLRSTLTVFRCFSMLAGADLVDNMVVKEKTLRDRLTVLNNREQAMVAKFESVQQELDEIVGSLK